MSTFEPDVDAYGTYARASALADFLEWQSITGRSMSKADLADYISDNEWYRKEYSPFNKSQTLDDHSDPDDDLGSARAQSEMFSQMVFDRIRNRQSLAPDIYPFSIQRRRLSYEGPADLSHSYIALLSITLAHAYDVGGEFSNPRSTFEAYVAEALGRRGLKSANLGLKRKESDDLKSALYSIRDVVVVNPSPDSATISSNAQEEGVDTISHLVFSAEDYRPGRWVFIGQATCQKSDGWQDKIDEPGPNMWKDLLGMKSPPFPFFAVPHHAPEMTIKYLAGKTSGTFLMLDRMRLSHVNVYLNDDIISIINAIEKSDVIRR